MVSKICTLWPLLYHQEFSIFNLMQPVCPDIRSFAHFDDCHFTSFLFFNSDATHMSRWLPSNRRWLPTNYRRLPTNCCRLPSTFFNQKRSCPLKNDLPHIQVWMRVHDASMCA